MAKHKRLKPKPKHEKKSWQTRNANREVNQRVYAENVARHDAMLAQAAAEAEAISAIIGQDDAVAT